MLLHIIEIIDVFTICYFTVECLNVFIKMTNSYTFSPRPLVWWSIPKVEYLIRWICAPRKLKFMKVYRLFLLLLVVIGRNQFQGTNASWRVCKKRNAMQFPMAPKNRWFPRPQWTWSTSWRSSLSTSPSCSRASRTLRSSARLARSSGLSRWQLKAKSRIDVDYLWVKKCIFLPRRWCGFWGFIALFVTLQACSLYSSPSNRHSAYIWYNIETKMVWCHWNMRIQFLLVLRLTKSLDFSSSWLLWQF